MYSFRTLLRTFGGKGLHLIYISWSVDTVAKAGLENLEQLLYLCIFRFLDFD